VAGVIAGAGILPAPFFFTVSAVSLQNAYGTGKRLFNVVIKNCLTKRSIIIIMHNNI